MCTMATENISYNLSKFIAVSDVPMYLYMCSPLQCSSAISSTENAQMCIGKAATTSRVQMLNANRAYNIWNYFSPQIEFV